MITTHAARTPIHTILPSRAVGREKRSASRRMPHGRRVATRPAKTAPTGSAPRHPDLLNGSRRARVARGSGTQPADVNRLLKQYTQMEKMMGKFARGGMKGLMRQMGGAMKGMGGRGMVGR